jgi:hypothetical protein
MAVRIKFQRLWADYRLGVLTVLMSVLGGIVSSEPPATPLARAVALGSFVLLGVIMCLFVYLQHRERRAGDEVMHKKIDQLQNAAAEAARLQTLTNELQERVLARTQENAELTKSNTGVVSGGDSVCWMNFIHQWAYPCPVSLVEGKFPLYGVRVKIFDISAEQVGIRRDDISIDLGDLSAGRAWMNPTARLPFTGGTAQEFNVFFSARNGMWNQKLLTRKVADDWLTATRVWRCAGSEAPEGLAFERVDSAFPRDDAGEVDWGV